MANSIVSEISDKNGVVYDIAAKSFDGNRTVSLTGDVTATQSGWNGSGQLSLATEIAAGVVGTTELAESAVTSTKLAAKAVTLAKFADEVTSGSIGDSESLTHLATQSAIKTYVDNRVTGNGSYIGKLTVAQINARTADSLNNGDHVICSDSGDITLSNPTITARTGEDLIFYKSGDTAVWQSMDGDFKLKQSAKEDSSWSTGTAGISFIASISQDANGEITATKASVRDASTSQKGAVQLSSTSSSSDESTAATPKGVWAAINTLDVSSTGGSGKYIQAISETNGKISATAQDLSTTPTKDSTVAITSGAVYAALGGSGVTDTYSSTGKQAVDGTAIASAIAGQTATYDATNHRLTFNSLTFN